ncbi:hypothetical protein Nepgr_010427 [Nepenthes gracilis]|uniref:Uncharacterized protein n=1 Tax=Nepenthes gracilis TaxID=150966 RepID=A0AAD3SCP0_NEPGR|nr:hypothetical protein Nepgr_010427 [Nepenthes gracilis]
MERLNFARVCVEVTRGAHLPSVIRLKSGSEITASSVDIEVSYLRKPMHPLKGRLVNPDSSDHDGLESVRLGNSVVDGCVGRALVEPRCEEPQTTRRTYREMLAMHDAACKREMAKRRRKAASRKPKVPKHGLC